LSFSLAFSVKKSVKNNGYFSPIFSLKNLKCSTSASQNEIAQDGIKLWWIQNEIA
jgi:hypothetical protein